MNYRDILKKVSPKHEKLKNANYSSIITKHYYLYRMDWDIRSYLTGLIILNRKQFLSPRKHFIQINHSDTRTDIPIHSIK